MTSIPQRADDELREIILGNPDLILEDPELMRTLVAQNGPSEASNVVDLRGVAMDRLEARLDRLEETHRSVIAAAYENLTGTNQIHRAVLRLLDPNDFEGFLTCLAEDVAEILRVDYMRLVLETGQASPDPALSKLGEVLVPSPEGFAAEYIAQGRGRMDRKVILRQVQPDNDMIYGDDAGYIRSEACLQLDLGEGNLPAMLVMGSEDPHLFAPSQGTDLLTFFANAAERALRRWLA